MTIEEITTTCKIMSDTQAPKGNDQNEIQINLCDLLQYPSLLSMSKSVEEKIVLYEHLKTLHYKLELCEHIRIPFIDDVNPWWCTLKDQRFATIIPIECKTCKTLFLIRVLTD